MPDVAERPAKPDRSAQQLGRLRGVDLFTIGEHRGKEYTLQDLRDIVANFKRYQAGNRPLMRVPAVLGHSEDQSFLEQEGLPACGWLSDLYLDGDHLRGDFEDIHPKAFPLLENKSYRTVSAEIYDDPPNGIPGTGCMLRRIAFLGGDIPEVKGLEELPALEKYAEATRRQLTRYLHSPTTVRLNRITARADRAGTYFVFSEVGPMNRDEMMKKLAEGGWDEDHLKGLNDKQMAEACRMHDELTRDKDDDHEDHDEKEPSDEEVGKMSEEERKEKAEAFSARSKKYASYAAKFSMKHDEPASEPEPTGGSGDPPPKKTTVTHQFSEKAVRQIVASAVAEVRKEFIPIREQTEQLAANTKRANIQKFCEAMVASGKVLAAEMDPGDPKNPRPTLADRLMRADARTVVHKFREGGKEVALTELDLQMREIEARPVLQRFGERVKTGDSKPGDVEEETGKVRRFAESNADFAKALEAAGRTPEEYVAAFAKAKKENPRLTAKQYGVPEGV